VAWTLPVNHMHEAIPTHHACILVQSHIQYVSIYYLHIPIFKHASMIIDVTAGLLIHILLGMPGGPGKLKDGKMQTTKHTCSSISPTNANPILKRRSKSKSPALSRPPKPHERLHMHNAALGSIIKLTVPTWTSSSPWNSTTLLV
jgi:hypothetical protein